MLPHKGRETDAVCGRIGEEAGGEDGERSGCNSGGGGGGGGRAVV
eukprot:COSAG02_NODE_31193_length_537_cov_5.325472_2_plen_44_part_01